eukprot:1159615-Pelagomonas_calceolata.AAC.8
MLVNSCKVSLYRLTARQGQATFLALQVVPARAGHVAGSMRALPTSLTTGALALAASALSFPAPAAASLLAPPA